jgi:hypothetical protein
MPTLYYKQLEAIHNVWGNATNWFTNPEATVSAGGVPWVSNNAFKTYDLAFATGQTLSPLIGEDASSGVIGQFLFLLARYMVGFTATQLQVFLIRL